MCDLIKLKTEQKGATSSLIAVACDAAPCVEWTHTVETKELILKIQRWPNREEITPLNNVYLPLSLLSSLLTCDSPLLRLFLGFALLYSDALEKKSLSTHCHLDFRCFPSQSHVEKVREVSGNVN